MPGMLEKIKRFSRSPQGRRAAYIQELSGQGLPVTEPQHVLSRDAVPVRLIHRRAGEVDQRHLARRNVPVLAVDAHGEAGAAHVDELASTLAGVTLAAAD